MKQARKDNQPKVRRLIKKLIRNREKTMRLHELVVCDHH